MATNKTRLAVAAAALLAPLLMAQGPEPARPGRGPQQQSSVPNAAPAATTTQTTGATDQPPQVKQMNTAEKNKIEKEGK